MHATGLSVVSLRVPWSRLAARAALALLAPLALLALPGCGGGGSAGGAAPAQVQGKVLSRDGAATNLGGVEVTCEGTGTTVTTGPDGSFVLEVPDGTVVRVRFADPLARGLADLLSDCEEGDDDTPDESDASDDSVEVEALGTGEVVTIEVELADGRVIECGVSRSESGGVVVHCEGNLFPTDPDAPAFSLAEIEINQADGCTTVEVEAEHLTPNQTLSLVLVAPDGARETLGTGTVDADGVLHASLTRCEGDPLPFGAASIEDLAGYGALVEDQDGNVLLAGQVPGLGYEFGEDGWHGGWGDEDGEGGSVPGFPGGLPDGFPAPPTDEEIQDLLDFLNGLLGGGGLSDFFPGGFPGFPS